MLKVAGISKRFGGYLALDDVSCEIVDGRHSRADRPERRGQDDVVQRHLRDASADRRANPVSQATDYTGRRPDLVLAMGIARNFQQVRLFPGLSVVENIAIGCHSRPAAMLGILAAVSASSKDRRTEAARDTARSCLRLVGHRDTLGRRGSRQS